MLRDARRNLRRNMTRTARPRVLALFAGVVLAACQQGPTKEEIEAAKNTFQCKYAGERIVIRFDATLHEARLLMPDGSPLVLHQIPAASGVRFSNGTYELSGKGTELKLARDGAATELVGCENVPLPAAKS
jgi:membrane-bound inhibitor of C-type lysozyme